MYRFALFMILLAVLLTPLAATAENDLGHGDDCWWCNRENFSLDDDATVWKYLMADITVLDTDMQAKVYLLDAPNGSRVKTGKYEGFLYGTTVSVHVLKIEGAWALIEGYDMSNQLLQGYVKANLLKTVSPNRTYGMVVDKQTQRLHLYKDGAQLSELLVSTGLPEEGKAYNETAAGEFLIGSRSGGFWSGNMFCDMGLRFDGGDLLHLVPCLINSDGSRNYAPFEPLLGTRASHGCIRVQLKPTAEGINMKWLWDNIKIGTK
ncbi:MAG TPA: L,D-transpeptidase, partial [Clostridia bacterium]|nr:L,D-transpeptidase [Clostridia bacterium]